jgi:hypothetical protein
VLPSRNTIGGPAKLTGGIPVVAQRCLTRDMSQTRRALAIAAPSYVPVVAWLALAPLLGDLSLGPLLLIGMTWVAASVAFLVWASFALVLGYKDTPPADRAAFLATSLALFALAWLTWLGVVTSW